MQIYKIDNREIKSFRLRQKNTKLQNFFNTKENMGMFMVSDTLHPENRINLKKETKEHNLNLTLIQKKVINLWIKTGKWDSFVNLLSGNIIKVTSKNKKNISINTLKYLFEHKELTTQFLIWNHQIYRKSHILNFMNSDIQNFQSKKPIQLILKKTSNIIWNNKHLVYSNHNF